MNAQIALLSGLLLTALASVLPAHAEAGETRRWRDASGKYEVLAMLTHADAEHAWLKKTSGSVSKAPVAKLSTSDQDHLREQQRLSAAKLPDALAGAWRAMQQAGRNRFVYGGAREWTDNTGRHTAKASLVGMNDTSALLRMLGGQMIEAPLARLSERDRNYSRQRGRNWSPLTVWRPVAAQVAPQVQDVLNGETPSLDVFPTPDAVHVRVGTAYLNRRFARDIEKKVPVNDHILGTPIRGEAVVNGDVRVVPVPAEGRGALMVMVDGTARSRTVGTHHPVWIHSAGHTEFHGTKKLFLNDDGVRFLPADVTASTRSRTTGVSTSLPRLRGRIARRVATRRLNESGPAADRISAEHNEVRVARDIDRQVEESLRRTDTFLKQHQDRVREALGLEGTKTVYSSTDEYLEFAFVGADAEEDGPRPPEFVADSDLEIVLHTPTIAPAALAPGAKALLTNLFNALLEDVLDQRADRHDREPANCRLVWSQDQQWLVIQADGPPDAQVSLAPSWTSK